MYQGSPKTALSASNNHEMNISVENFWVNRNKQWVSEFCLSLTIPTAQSGHTYVSGVLIKPDEPLVEQAWDGVLFEFHYISGQ